MEDRNGEERIRERSELGEAEVREQGTGNREQGTGNREQEDDSLLLRQVKRFFSGLNRACCQDQN